MANEFASYADLQKHRGNDAGVGLIDEVSKFCPELNLLPVKPIKGRSYKTLILTELPKFKFRNAYEGTDYTKAKRANREFQTYIGTARWALDRALAKSNPDETPQEQMAKEASAHVLGAWQAIAGMLYYGRMFDDLGFPGLIESYNREKMEIDVEGDEADAGSSVWMIRAGKECVQWVSGLDGVFDPSEVTIGDEMGTNGKPFTALKQELEFFMGLQVGSDKAVARIKNLTPQGGKGLTDDLLGELKSKFALGWQPTHILMSSRSREQLRKSRQATNATGAPAPTPTEYENIPIVATESILDTEAIEA